MNLDEGFIGAVTGIICLIIGGLIVAYLIYWHNLSFNEYGLFLGIVSIIVGCYNLQQSYTRRIISKLEKRLQSEKPNG